MTFYCFENMDKTNRFVSDWRLRIQEHQHQNKYYQFHLLWRLLKKSEKLFLLVSTKMWIGGSRLSVLNLYQGVSSIKTAGIKAAKNVLETPWYKFSTESLLAQIHIFVGTCRKSFSLFLRRGQSKWN